MSNTKVLVIGQLGELAKKIYELEKAIVADPKNQLAMIELKANGDVLRAWPLDNPENFPTLLVDFQLALIKYEEANKDFEGALVSKNHLRLDIDACAYYSARENVKTKMSYLNALGRFVGPVHLLELNTDEQGATNADHTS